MADDLTALAQLGHAEAGGGAEESTSEAGPTMASRVRSWFVEAWSSKLWSDYRRESKEDMGFYVGGDGQWSQEGSTEALTRLRAAGRAAISIKHIQAIVDVLTGFERQNRYDLKTVPQGEEDAEDAELMTWLLKHVQEQTDAHHYSSEAFENTTIRGMAALEVGIDWTRDPVYGDILLEPLTPGEDVIWDPHWTRPDLSDARYVLRFKTAWIEDLIAQYPEHELLLREQVGALEAAREGGKLSEFSPTDAYGSVQHHPNESDEIRGMFYDSSGGGRAMVVQAWYADHEDAWIVSDQRAGSVTEVETETAARQMAAADPESLTAIRRRRRVVRSCVALPATYQTLEEDETPYENDEDAYPIVPCFGKKKGDVVYGIVRNLKDPQRVENKRESQLIDLIANIAALRLVYEENALVTPATLKDPFSREPIAVRAGHGGATAVGYLVPPVGEIVNVLRGIGDRNKMHTREISGINTELLGLEQDQSSGIAIARRQAQGQVISTVWFDNYRTFRRLLGKRLARRIQQVYTMERTLRVVGPHGAELLIQINPAEARDLMGDEVQRYKEERRAQDGRPTVLRDVKALKYDVVISEVPTTPTMRATSLLAILEILRVLPGLAPALLDVVVELAEIPDRTKIMERVKQLMSPAAGGTGQGEPGPGKPAPPETPTPPAGLSAPSSVGAAGLPLEGLGPPR